MTTYSDSDIINSYIEDAKKQYNFDQVMFSNNEGEYINFNCLKGGEEIKLRKHKMDLNWEVFHGRKWVDIGIHEDDYKGNGG